ncbi:MAG: hypothetical protein DRP74_07785, partial [Candidatus Omnitrophota bacterium]
VYNCNETSNNGWVTGNGGYNCTWDSSGNNVGKYNVTMSIVKNYYLSSTDSLNNAFKINATPMLTAADVTPRSDGWSLQRTFTVNVTDNIGDNVTASLYELVSGTWVKIGETKNCSSCSNYVMNWTKTYSCSDVATGSRQFKVNATDTEGNTYTTTGTDYVGGSEAFTIEKNNVIIQYVTGNETNATNVTPTNLIVRVYDTDSGTYNLNPSAPISFNVTKEGVNGQFYEMTTVNTNSTGSAVYTFYADTSFNPTKQAWFGFIDTAETPACYKFNQSLTYNVTTLSNLPTLSNEIVGPVTGGWGDVRTFNVTILDYNSTATVYLWKAQSLDGPWTLLDQQNYNTPGTEENKTFTYEFGCTDIGSGTWYFKFNASNEVGNVYSTQETTSNYFTLAKDYISYINVIGNETVANRSGNQTQLLKMQWWDANGSVVTGLNVTFKATFDNSIWDSGTINTTNNNGYVEYSFNPTCTPRYYVGPQKWQAIVQNDQCYQDNETEQYNFTIKGDILLTLSKPDGSLNFTQEDVIPFLGYTVDDCGTALSTNVSFYMNSSTSGYNCNDTAEVVPIGANAYSCDMVTSLNTERGYYNVSMFATADYHYDNFTKREKVPGLFYLFSLKKLEQGTVVPSTAGWGYPNWNFSVISSSGDPDTDYEVKIYIGSTWPPTTECTDCVNKTAVVNSNNLSMLSYWVKNWTYNQKGTWYYRYSIADTYTTTVSYVTVTEDNTNISYVAGNDTTAEKDGQIATLIVRVFDKDANTFNLDPNATVTFKLLNSAYSGGEKVVGTVKTNDTGYATFDLNITNCDYQAGLQKWRAEITSAEENYNISKSGNYSITLVLSGCTATVDVYPPVLTPNEVFQNNTFIVNATVTAWISAAKNVTMKLNTSSIWQVDNKEQFFASIGVGSYQPVTWNVNATTYGTFILNISANSSNAGTDSELSDSLYVYKKLKLNQSIESMPININTDNYEILSWLCPAANYRTANINITWNATSTWARVYVYDGYGWKDVMHSKYINASLKQTQLNILNQQMFPNSTGFCNVKIENVGDNILYVKNVTMEAFYQPTVKIRDLVVKIDNSETTGFETRDKFFNVTVKIENSDNTNYNINVTLNVTDENDNVVNSSKQEVIVNAGSTVYVNFTNINTTGWNQELYTMKAYVTGDKNDNRNEIVTLKNVTAVVNTVNYMCNLTTEYFNVTIVHPFNESVQYNVSLTLPTGWNYSGSQVVTTSGSANYTLKFNITASNSPDNVTIIANINYTFPSSTKSITRSFNIEMNNNIPILEVVRETPKVIGSNKVFDSALVIHNKGCAATTGTTVVKELLSTGWVPANPSIEGDVTLNSATTDLINNIITWNLGSISVNSYAVLTYQIKAPSSYPTLGTLNYNATWNGRYLRENKEFNVQTYNYSGESHLEFDLTVVQQSDNYPWPEPRSSQLNKLYNYSLEVENVGDVTATGWNVTLLVPTECEFFGATNNGAWSSSERKIEWELANVEVYDSTYLNFTLNCTEEGKHILVAEAVKNTTQFTSYMNDTSIGCSGASCSDNTLVTFSQPANIKYEKLRNVDFKVEHDWNGVGVTIAEGAVNFTDDDNIAKIVWQKKQFNSGTESEWINYTIEDEQSPRFVDSNRYVGINSYVDASSGETGNVNVSKIAYTWQHGKLFKEPQQLFIKTKVYEYVPLYTNFTLWINNNDSKTTGGWGESFNFTVMVRDRFSRNVTVMAWHKTGIGSYEQIDNWTCVNCGAWTQANFS